MTVVPTAAGSRKSRRFYVSFFRRYKERSLNRHDDRNVPPGLRLIVGLIMHGMLPPGVYDGSPPDKAEVCEGHQAWHQSLIQTWESSEPELAERFGKMIAADLIELTRMANRACNAEQAGLSSLLMSVGKLMVLADGDPDAMRQPHWDSTNLSTELKPGLSTTAAVAEAQAETEARGRARAESNGQPAAESGTKAENEGKDEAKARRKAEAKAKTVKFRGKPESN